MKTSALESLRVEDCRAEFLLDGRPICVQGDARSPTLAALRELNDHARADYEAHRARSAQRIGILARLGSWFGRFWRKADTVESLNGAPDPAGSVHFSSTPTAMPAHANRPLAAETPVSVVQTEQNDGATPRLRIVFADEKGVHVVWQEIGAHSAMASTAIRGQTEFTYTLDSDFARRLHRCFQELSILGYKVNGAELLAGISSFSPSNPTSSASTPAIPVTALRDNYAKNAGSARPADDRPSTETRPAATITNEVTEPKHSTEERTNAASESGETTSAEIIMRLHPPAAGEANRALVSPVEDREKPEVLIAPERVLRALHAAADSTRPESQQLRYLRCNRGENGLRIVAVGFGETGERTPRRWEDAKKWWSETGQKLADSRTNSERAPEIEATKKLGPTFVPGTAPLQLRRESMTHAEAGSSRAGASEPEPG